MLRNIPLVHASTSRRLQSKSIIDNQRLTMLLTRRTLFFLLLAAALLAGATFAPLLIYVAAAYLSLVFVMILTDCRISPRAPDFEVARVNDQRLSLGAQNLVSIHVTHRGK